MSKLLLLCIIFIKIGVVAFGGGWAIVGMVQKELVGGGYLSITEFSQAVAVSQMTPGPVAINLATYTGYKIYGVPGAVCATVALLLPSVFLLLTGPLLARFFIKDRSAAVKALNISTLLLMSYSLVQLAVPVFHDFTIYIIAAGAFCLLTFTKLEPLLIVFISGFAGMGLYSLIALLH